MIRGQGHATLNVRIETLTDEDGPEVDEGEESNICELLERKDKRIDVVGYALCETIHGVEGVTGIRRRHNPLVMRLVQRLVNLGMMQTPVNPVDAQVREGNEQRELKDVIEGKRSICRSVVKFSIATNFKEEEGRGEDRHQRH